MIKEFFGSSRTGKTIRFTNTLRVERPAGVVFGYLADLRNLPAWNYAIRETLPVTPGPARRGSVYEQTRSLPRIMRERLEIVEFEPDRRLVMEGGFGPFQGRATYDLTGSGTATDLVNEFELVAETLHAPSGLVARGMAGAVAKNLRVLKDILETSPTGR
ncbi:SRPBCC family protein [Sphaerisporangium corydalis]|uniref:SRPBCC family protein n=1 Tax=Sphaerisporangium corydalis TaxID=1441875 RepID=A0ABV9EFL4_9ACTN|nr:SRPBCC family protein [Sphaerisporangium corydalis]